MGTASLHLDALHLAWRGLWSRLASERTQRDCLHLQRRWRRLGARPAAVRLEGSCYCINDCLERALDGAFQRALAVSKRTPAPHRVPLGLLLLSRQLLTAEQLRTALDAQRTAGRGRIGEWLQALGYSTEHQVTAALARQWSCPVLRGTSSLPPAQTTPQIPITLLESFAMIPVNYGEARATLHMAFGEGIDYSILYAIERMTGCHTEPCMAASSFVRAHLRSMSGQRTEHEAVFERVADIAEFSRIVRSYAASLSASEIRLASCAPYIWVRLLRASRPPQDLIFRSLRA